MSEEFKLTDAQVEKHTGVQDGEIKDVDNSTSATETKKVAKMQDRRGLVIDILP